ncbi:C40 family peptidase [Streptomyces sp. HNM0574]|uniref:C40 family peptidase n=1 Tax=Streptomyces sp. HNM0574 TaxID=2714954 RepID=UPI00146AF172|nr:C40 family peptidase [Streptomyces sp. HNM0574]NLU66850.1 glycoside hydrolase [Streptomyces sp. HNM0574]
MASHRKPRTPLSRSAATRRGAASVTTAALASVTLLSQNANAAPADGPGGAGRPSVEDVRAQVDKLYREAGSSTQQYNAAKEKTEAQRDKVEKILGRVAARTEKLNDARRVLGSYATAQYRTGGMSQTATLLLTQDPQGFFRQTHLLERMTGRQERALTAYEEEQRAAAGQRREATKELAALSEAQSSLRADKRDVQAKLAEARQLLSQLTAEEKARLAAIERQKEAEARRVAAERAERAEAERRQAEQERRQREDADQGAGQGSGSGGAPSGQVEKVLAFAEQQLGKPYVWGATGPSSYDCSGFTQDAWKAAGISLPRTTYDQVKVGTKVEKSAMRPGDLVFFYDDISHVGIYVGDGQMIHASKPGDDVKYESVDYMPFHSAVRPA